MVSDNVAIFHTTLSWEQYNNAMLFIAKEISKIVTKFNRMLKDTCTAIRSMSVPEIILF